jgi:hypothetical protein
MSYMATVEWVVYATLSGAGSGKTGGVLNYYWLKELTVQSVSTPSPSVVSFPDVLSYLFLMLQICNLTGVLASIGSKPSETEDDRAPLRYLAARNLVLSILLMAAYVWTMRFVDMSMKSADPAGGVVLYAFPLGITILHVYQGHTESSIQWWTNDFTLWLLIILAFSTLYTVWKQMSDG